MLKLYYGRANVDLDRFLFDRIRRQLAWIENEGKGRVLIIVPDQFTLQAERNAFDYLKVSGLMDIDILSFSRLGAKVLDENGGTTRAHVDKYGRHMLLSKVTLDEQNSLLAFKGLSQKHSFLDMVNNLISEMKQFNIKPEDIPDIQKVLPEGSILNEKLRDIYQIYLKYEDLIRGKYVDTEDYLDLFMSKIELSTFVREAEIWIDGFDYHTPKMLAVINELVKTAKNVHIIMTLDSEGITSGSFSEDTPGIIAQEPNFGKRPDQDLFELPQRMRRKFIDKAMENGYKYSEESIGVDYSIKPGFSKGEKAPEILHLEQELYASPYQPFKVLSDEPNSSAFDFESFASENSGFESSAIEFCLCSNYYTEAETAAAKIRELVREKGMRYRDILVICNDMENRASIIKRTFEDYELPFFIDQKRTILHNPCIEYISALMDILSLGWRYEDVFRLIKTGLTSLSVDEWERLDNYAFKYRIKGNRWKSEFKFGKNEEGEEELSALNKSRTYLVTLISDFEKKFQMTRTVRDKTLLLYDFLDFTAEIPVKAEALVNYLRDHDALEYAEETEQIWDVIINMLDQLVLLIGDEEISLEAYGSLLKTGFEEVEIGILPPTIDQIIIGTMQRTRTGPIQALFILGANDGVLPAASSTEGLLSEDEKAVLLKRNVELCKNDDLRILEERLAIYKSLSKPSRYLWVGCAAADLEGREVRPSLILDKLRKLFPYLGLSKDLFNMGDPLLLVANGRSTLSHMTDELRRGYETGQIDNVWKAVYNWFNENKCESKCKNISVEKLDKQQDYAAKLKMIRNGMLFDNKVEKLSLEAVKSLYGRGSDLDLTLSPSRIEGFAKCPFAYFINYGLKAEEREIFEVSGREMGDIYHDCLKRLSYELTLDGVDVTSAESPWMLIEKEACDNRIEQIVSEAAAQYKEGILGQGEAEQYRLSRIKSVCRKSAWMMVSHVQSGSIKRSYFEAGFGRGEDNRLPPIKVTALNERIYIEGKIDRIDVIEARVKIIDYKSGNDQFNMAEVLGGWRLQLMLYLRAAEEGLAAKPAGAFYFKIDEGLIDETLPHNASPSELTEATEKLASLVKKRFKMDGVVLKDPQVIRGIAGEFNGVSDIIPISINKDGEFSASPGKLLSEDEFAAVKKAVDITVDELCTSLLSGSIDITPKRIKTEITACTYCSFKSICNFDLSFPGCKYINVY